MTTCQTSCQDCGVTGKRLWSRSSDGLEICFACFHVTAKQPSPHPPATTPARIPRPRHPFLSERTLDWGYRPRCQICHGERYALIHQEAS